MGCLERESKKVAGLIFDIKAELDADRISELLSLMGSEKLLSLLDILDQRLHDVSTRLEMGEGLRSLIDMVHQSQGSAGSLGFIRVAVALEELERLMKLALDDTSDSISSARRQLLLDTTTLLLQTLRRGREHIGLEGIA